MNKHRKNPFKEIAPKEVAPKELKKQVMDSVELGHMLMDMADLFTIKMGNAAMKLLDNKAQDQNGFKKNIKDNEGHE